MDQRKRDYAERIRTEGEISDGGKHIIVCSNCPAKLVEVWVTKPELDVSFELRAECDYCGDKSFVFTVKGGFHLGITDDCKIASYVAVEEDMDSRKIERIQDSYIVKTSRRKKRV